MIPYLRRCLRTAFWLVPRAIVTHYTSQGGLVIEGSTGYFYTPSRHTQTDTHITQIRANGSTDLSCSKALHTKFAKLVDSLLASGFYFLYLCVFMFLLDDYNLYIMGSLVTLLVTTILTFWDSHQRCEGQTFTVTTSLW